MAGKSESIDAYDIKNADWDTPFRGSPSASEGEFSAPGTNAVVADLNAPSFSETSRTPYDGDTSGSQGKFRTKHEEELNVDFEAHEGKIRAGGQTSAPANAPDVFWARSGRSTSSAAVEDEEGLHRVADAA
jgi:CCR4-NOT transcriptional regulation complex NOT5 subunit